MAAELSGSAVIRKYWLVGMSAALILCVVVSLLLVSRIDYARSHLAQNNPGAFNYFIQSHRNLNAFVDALRQSRAQHKDSEAATDFRRQYRQRFDVIWGGFTVFDVKFRFRPEQQQQVSELLEYTTDYLKKNEPLMAPTYELSDAEVQSLIEGARTIGDKVSNIGHQYFISAIDLSDFWNQELRHLYQLFWIGVIFLILTGTLLFSMLVRSNRQSADLIEKSQGTQRKMKQLIAELRSGKLENKAKDNFIAAASHDLRQPLHALGLFLGATEKHIDNDAGREALAEAKTCTAELNRLFNSLLDLSRLDAGVVEANKTQFEIGRLLQLMDHEFSALAKQDGILFQVCQDAHCVNTDAILLNRILRNLLENAFSHSEATEIRILCERKQNTVRLTVSDNGVGIPLAEQSDIFCEYYQLDNPERDRSKGLGLGLSIVKRLCEILGVTVTLESDAKAGTMFHLDVPAGQISESLLNDTPTASSKNLIAPEGTLVAVIDDDANVRRGMVLMLGTFDFAAIAAESADEMIELLRLQDELPDVLIADYRLLNNQTGDKAIRTVRSAFGVDFPAMIITGDTSPGRMSEAASSGFELLHKPIEPAKLMQSINKLVRPKLKAVAEHR